MENIQSDSRPGGTHIAAVEEDGAVAAEGESRTAMRMRRRWMGSEQVM